MKDRRQGGFLTPGQMGKTKKNEDNSKISKLGFCDGKRGNFSLPSDLGTSGVKDREYTFEILK